MKAHLRLWRSAMVLMFVCYYMFVREKYTFLERRMPALRTKRPVSDRNEDFLYFVQITDTHITHKQGFLNDRGLSELIGEVNALRPAFLVHTGDITDGASASLSFDICEDDFRAYSAIRSALSCPVYDVRGNHDTFGADKATNDRILETHLGGKRNFYRILETENCKYLCMFVDATPEFGAKRLYNFFGHFDDSAFGLEIRSLKARHKFDQILLFTHYSANTLCTKDHSTLESSVYVCGHLHNMVFFDNIYKRYKNGCVETVLEDFKASRKFRICTLDHGYFSFNDFRVDGKPRVVIMTPASGSLASTDTRVLRFLAFSYDSVAVEVDGRLITGTKREGAFHCTQLPETYKKISVVARNRHGETRHTVSDEVHRWRSIPLDLPLEYVPAVLMLFYIAVFWINAARIPAYIPLIRVALLMLLPNAMFKPFNNKHFEALRSFALGRVFIYDTVVSFAVSLALVESLFVMALVDSAYAVPYNLVSLLFAIILNLHFGLSFRLEDLFLFVSNCYFISRFLTQKCDKKWK